MAPSLLSIPSTTSVLEASSSLLNNKHGDNHSSNMYNKVSELTKTPDSYRSSVKDIFSISSSSSNQFNKPNNCSRNANDFQTSKSIN